MLGVSSPNAELGMSQRRQTKQFRPHEHDAPSSSDAVAATLRANLVAREARVVREHSLAASGLGHDSGDVFERAHALLARLPSTVMVRGLTPALSMDIKGCRLVQATLQVCTASERKILAAEMTGYVREACESPHGNHVMQRLIELLPPAALSFIMPELVRTWDSASMARDKFGCRVLERLVEHFTAISPAREALAAFLNCGALREADQLCFHYFGNFVMQHLLEFGSLDQKQVILKALQKDLQKVVLDENAALVLGKALTYAPPAYQEPLAADLLRVEDLTEPNRLPPFFRDVVIEPLLSVLDGSPRAELRAKLNMRADEKKMRRRRR